MDMNVQSRLLGIGSDCWDLNCSLANQLDRRICLWDIYIESLKSMAILNVQYVLGSYHFDGVGQMKTGYFC
jgi:hypothetical protein